MVIDLAQLPPPEVLESLDFENLYQQLLALFRTLMGERWEAPLESDPVIKLLELAAYRELQLRARINDAACSVLLAFAVGADLEQLAANVNVSRRLVTPGDPQANPPVVPCYESDSSLRARVPQAFEGLSVAGSLAAYRYRALSADGRVIDASVESPQPATVVVTLLSSETTGAASTELLITVEQALSGEAVRPVADRLTVQAAEIVPYRINAGLWLYPGPAIEPIMAASRQQVIQYTQQLQRLGRDIRCSVLFATLQVEGIQRVELIAPAGDLILSSQQAAYCEQIDLSYQGADE
ncbi:baseplate assembly protein [unidentified bacterial endosymbiont]|uniref:baseplate assembly protein n=1 Tax=unidentified bacterial endosymbiont TaxID=2355 RepID=UPI00209C9207|nr:baseplate J/gp47 family protein [unidentified bacterial endosymbiont]